VYVLSDCRNIDDVSGACYCPESAATGTAASLWWMLLLLILVLTVAGAVVYVKSVNRERQVQAANVQPQPQPPPPPEDGTSDYMQWLASQQSTSGQDA